MEQKQKFPTEMVELPSKGLLYPKDSPLASGTIEMKYMTAREEDIQQIKTTSSKEQLLTNYFNHLL